MAGLTLLTGGPASGKTERLLELAAGRYRGEPFADTLVLVTTARHADQFRRRLVARSDIAFGLDVVTLNLFAARHTFEVDIVPRDVARELLARVTLDRVAAGGPASRFRPIAHTRGLHTLVSTAIADLVADAIEPDAFAEAATRTGNADLLALADIYAAYSSGLRQRGWHAPEERARLAAAAIREAALPSMVLVDGVQSLRAGEVELLAAMAAQTDMWVTLDTDASARAGWAAGMLRAAVPGLRHEALDTPSTSVAPFEAFTTADDEAQLREIARSIKSRLVEDSSLRPSDFAVAFRRVGPHLAPARRVFREYGLPLDPAAGERLTERPFGVWTLRLLRLGVHGWRLLEALETCAAGFFDGRRLGLEDFHLGGLRQLGRRQMLWSGLDTLRQLPDAARQAVEDGDRRDWLLAAGEAWARTLELLSSSLDADATRTPGQHAALVDSLLFGAEGLAGSDVSSQPALAVEVAALRAELGALRATDEALGAEPMSFAAFVDLIETRLERPSTLIREAGGVLLAPMHTLHGLRFRYVYLAGLAEGEFPAPSRTDALLGQQARADLAAAGLALPPEQRSTEDELWRTATSRATDGISLWRPRFDVGGRPTAASYYFAASDAIDIETGAAPEQSASTRELAIALTRRWPGDGRRPDSLDAWDLVVRSAPPVEQRRRSFASAGRYEGEVPGIEVSHLVNSDARWSASRLESYRTCPFQFFARYGLRLSELDEEQAEAGAATRGTVMHEMLEDALAPLAEQRRALDAAGLVEALARLQTQGRAIWEQAPQRHAFGRAALWRCEGETAITLLEALLRREAELQQRFGMTAVAGREVQFEQQLPGVDPPLVVTATLDRIDTGPDTIQVVDYKTGRFIPVGEVEDGRRLQLQLYARVAQAELGARRVIARYAFLRPNGKGWWLDSDDSEHAALIDAAMRIAGEVRVSVSAGAFEVAPALVDCPRYCAARTLCRVNHFSRGKTWS